MRIRFLITPSVFAVFSCAFHGASSSTASATGDNNDARNVLVLLSGSSYVTTKEGTRHPTGYFLSELAGPAIALKRLGYNLTFATPNGTPPTMDSISDDVKWFKSNEAYLQAIKFVEETKAIRHPLDLKHLHDGNLERFDAILVPGGHAPLEDLVNNGDVGRILKHFQIERKPTALICHGPAALLSAHSQGKWLYSGYRMTAFSTEEEKQEEDAGHLSGHMPFYLDAELRRLGGIVEVAAPWNSKAVRDRELITAQNPMSEVDFVSLFLEALAEQMISGKTPTPFVLNQGIREHVFYTVPEQTINVSDWDGGYRTLWIGERRDGSPNFLNRLAPHVNLTWQSFQGMGLEGYVLYATEHYEIAFQRWESQLASERAFASVVGQAVIEDAEQIMLPVLFKETNKNPLTATGR